jgi:hypothetical protein
MSVVVARSSIAKQWRDDAGGMIGVRSKAPVETLLEIVSAAVERRNERQAPGYSFIGPWATPKGVALFVGDADTSENIVALADDIAASLEAVGIDARIGPLTSDSYPRPSAKHNDGFSAFITTVGQPHWDTPGDPGGRRLLQRMWDPDPEAQAQLIEHALGWCDVDGGGLWLTANISTFKIPREQAVELLLREVHTGTKCSIVAARDAGLVRRVEFGYNGYVIYELGGTARPDWQTCVQDLTTVLTDVHELIEWGFVQSRPPGTRGIGPRTSLVVHNALWEPHEDHVPTLGYRQDPRRFPELVLDVYGIQVLGPGHDVSAIGGPWDVQKLTHDRTLVTSRDPAAWFAQPPTLDTLLAARDSFGPLVDPIWSTTK